MRRIVVVAGLLLALFVVTAAPGGRSGGFGGGRGGFSSGRSGGFGGFGGGRSYGGGRGYGGPIFWGGPRIILWGARGPGLGFFLVLIGGVVVVAGAVAVANWYNSRYAMLSLGVNLRRGDRYARRFDEILADSEFESPSGRAKALHRLSKLIDPADVVDAFTEVRPMLGDRDAAGETAENVARSQMQRIGITADAVNVANTSGQSVRLDAPTSNGAARSEACVVSIVATLKQSALKGFQEGDERDALAALSKLYEVPSRDLDALYFYYAPNSSEPLDPMAANRLYLDLRATVRAQAV